MQQALRQALPIVAAAYGEKFGVKVLVLGWGPLLCSRKIDPQLHAVKQAALRYDLLGWHLRVHNACPGCHPLGCAVFNETSTTVRVAMLKLPIHHVGNGLESAMRMVWCAFGLTGGVFNSAHMV